MRQTSEVLREVLASPNERRVTVDVWHGSERVLQGVRVEGFTLDSNLEAEIKTSGSATLILDSPDGSPVAPVDDFGDVSAYTTTIEPQVRITAGPYQVLVSLGMFRATRTADATDYYSTVGDEEIVTGARVPVEFVSLDGPVRWDGLTGPESPPQRASAWTEIRRLTGMPVVESVPDVAIPASTVWEASEGSRLGAVQTLAGLLGGVAVVDSSGAWTVIPDELAATPVASYRSGDGGMLVDYSTSIDPAEVFNEVVGTYDSGDGGSISVVARLTTGPLSVYGLYGKRTKYVSGTGTVAEANAAVVAELQRSSGTRVYDLPVTGLFDPLVEIGDTVEVGVRKKGAPIVGKVTQVTLGTDATTSLVVRVRRDAA